MLKIYEGFVGNLMFASCRALRHEQVRFQDDIESLVYVAAYILLEILPWEDDRVRAREGLNKLQGNEFKDVYKQMRINRRAEFERVILSHCQDYMQLTPGYMAALNKLNKNDENDNPFYMLLKVIYFIN